MKIPLLPYLLLIGAPLLSLLAREGTEAVPVPSAAQVSPAAGRRDANDAPKKNLPRRPATPEPHAAIATPQHLFM